MYQFYFDFFGQIACVFRWVGGGMPTFCQEKIEISPFPLAVNYELCLTIKINSVLLKCFSELYSHELGTCGQYSLNCLYRFFFIK